MRIEGGESFDDIRARDDFLLCHNTYAPLGPPGTHPAMCRGFFDAYSKGLRMRFGSGATDESSDVRQALTTPDAATDVRLQGSDVLTVISFDRQSASAIADAVTSSIL